MIPLVFPLPRPSLDDDGRPEVPPLDALDVDVDVVRAVGRKRSPHYPFDVAVEPAAPFLPDKSHFFKNRIGARVEEKMF